MNAHWAPDAAIRVRLNVPGIRISANLTKLRRVAIAGLTSPANGRKGLLRHPKADPLMAPEKSAGEDSAMRRRRLRYRAWHRGTREMDLALGPFADARLEAMSEQELQRFEGLMAHEDTDLLKWVMGQEEPPAGVDRELLDQVIAFATSSTAR